jgi:hypothetical protein
MDLIQQFFLSLILIIGIVIGESLATKAFGRPKQQPLFLFELAVFVLVIILATTTLQYTQLSFIPLLAVNALIGVISAVVSRGVSTGLGYLSALPQKKPFQKYTNEERLLQNVMHAMCESGLKREEITDVLARSGYDRKDIDSIWTLKKMKTKPHPLLKRVAKLEEEVRELTKNS